MSLYRVPLVLGITLALLATVILSTAGEGFAQRTKSVRVQGREARNSGKRLALVIGNANYKSAPLRNPVNDARAMSATLRGLGFQVIALENASQSRMKRAIDDFGRTLRKQGGVGLFYYSGHGMQVRGRNYMVPVGAKVGGEADVEYESVDAGRVLAKMDTAGNGMNIVILDACRNNPFARSFRSASNGLATMDAPSGTLIAYATAPGKVAADGDGRNGLYTEQLIRYMRQPGLTLERVFKQVRSDVRRKSGGGQIPWEASSLEGEFFFAGASAPGKSTPPVVSSPQPATRMDAEDTLWKAVQHSRQAEDFRAYLKDYPNGRFAGTARVKIRQLERKKKKADTEIARRGGKIPVAILSKPPVGATKAEAAAIESSFWAAVAKSGRYAPVEKRRVASVLDESSLVGGDWEAQLHAVGKILNVRFILNLKVVKLSETLWQISASLIETNSAQTLRADSILHQGNLVGLLTEKVPALSARLMGEGNKHSASGQRDNAKPSAALTPQTGGNTWRDPVTGMQFVKVPGGSFEMGCHANAGECKDDEKPVRTVRLDEYWLGRHEVTVGQFERFINDSGYRTEAEKSGDCYVFEDKWAKKSGASWRNPGFQQNSNHPVACVTWDDTQAFAKWLSGKTGQRFRLPSEAQWEYACRAGGKPIKFGTGNGQVSPDNANYSGHNGGTTPVGSFAPNGLGLHDMAGNVWEWVQDKKTGYGNVGTDNPIYERTGAVRVVRGGGWFYGWGHLRCSNRDIGGPSLRLNRLGFRLLRLR